MPKKKTVEIVRRPEGSAPLRPARRTSGERQVRVMPPAAAVSKPKKRLPPRPAEGSSGQSSVPLMAGFENKVGRYELVRVEGDQAYYSFTNLQGRTVDAIMSVTMWRRMQSRADTTYQEIA